MDLIKSFIDIVLHLDQHLNEWIALFGVNFYGLMFLIVFAETGLVVTPFLPGDSLLFALGALSAGDDAFLKLHYLALTLISAALTGDLVNYTVGKFAGEKLFSNPHSKIFRRKYLEKTHRFYEKHGGKTIVLARFVPIVRTFAPFVAGMGKMRFTRFIAFSVGGAVTWVSLFLAAGHIFGNLPAIKRNFHVVIVAIILISVMPMVYEWWKHRQPKA